MRLTLLGTGDARQVPVYGCECAACALARSHIDLTLALECIEACGAEQGG